MIRYDYTDYVELLDSFDNSPEDISSRAEIFQNYVKLIDEFDPLHHPPEAKDKHQYIMYYIVPILQEYCRDVQAILEIEERRESVEINIICKYLFVIKEVKEFLDIICYADLISIKNYDSERIVFNLYFVG